MKLRLSAIFVLVAALAAGIYAQAGRNDAKNEDKKNPRAESTPTPTPAVKAPPGAAAGNSADDGEIIKVNTQLVSVPVRVMDKKGRFIGGLSKEDFKVFENGKEQELALFSNENEPFTVALMLDMSYSTKFKINEIQSAALAFIDQLRPQDKVLVVSFDMDVHVLCEATSDRELIKRAIKSTKIDDGTSLYEAVDLIINDRFRNIEGRKAMILFTDGVDTTSRKANDLGNLYDAMELDSLIYTIRYDTFADVQDMFNKPLPPKPKVSVPDQNPNPSKIGGIIDAIATPSEQGTTQKEYQRAVEYLDQLAARTGGRRYEATSLGNLAEAYSQIASELREFYSVAYYPSEERVAGKQSTVKVKVARNGVVVNSRETFTNRKPKAKPQVY
ncbi:MAG: VWA domain-containing protein [Pyrinomonadaceae bacterium]